MRLHLPYSWLLLCALCAWPVLAADLQSEGRVLLSEGENLAARNKFAEAAKINPFDAAAVNNQAVASAAQGDYENALNLLERAARLAPQRADIAANLHLMRSWVARNAPQIRLAEPSHPVVNVYPDAGLPPEPPPLWKK